MIVVARVVLALVAGVLAAAGEGQPLLFWVGLLVLAAAAAGATPRLGALLAVLAAAIGGARAFWGGVSLAFPTPGEWALALIYLAIWGAGTAFLAWTWRRKRLALLLALPVAAIVWSASHTSLINGFDPVVGSSLYVPMRDGVRIAIDVYLPRGVKPEARLPALVRQTRYVRSTELRWPFGLFLRAASPRRFVQAGYAVVVVDARGSGASFGSRPQEWSADEVRDGAEVVDWIVRQPWSSSKVGATGVSYDGTASEFLLVNRHPAVKAIAPRFSLFDPYTDIAFPGGIHHTWFTSQWGRYNSALDRNAYGEVLSGLPRLLVRGVKPVDEDRGRRLLKAAVAEHAANYDVHTFTLGLTYKDDAAPSGLTLEAMSPYRKTAEIEASGAAIYNYSGWFDGAYQFAAIRRFLAVRTPGSRLIIGPWDHGGRQNPSPYNSSTQSFDQTGELLRFFDYHVKGVSTGIEAEKPVRYFTMGEEKWKSADTWPPPAQPVAYYLASGFALAQKEPQEAEAKDTYRVDLTAGTGNASRWNSYFNVDQVVIGYPDRAEQDKKLASYTSAPLESDLEITGHPVLLLFVSSTASDGNFFAYLEEVDSAGRVRHVTEGSLRALHRKTSPPPAYASFVPYHSFKREDGQPLVPGEVAELVFDLLPTSYLVPRGHSLRLALAGADKDHCATPPGEPPTVHFHREALHASRLELPVVARQSR